MRKAGSESWRFAHDIDESLHFVLYLRDVLSLQVKEDAVFLPELAGDVPDRSEVVSPDSASAIAASWPSWWRAVVTEVAATGLRLPSQHSVSQYWLHEISMPPGLTVDPPEWVSLEGSPALRDAARMLWTESSRWFGSAREPYLPPSCLDVFVWEQVRDAAERAADEHEVGLGHVNGWAQVLLVEGSWWQIVAPGVALCSIAAARDPAIVPLILNEAFDSHLAR